MSRSATGADMMTESEHKPMSQPFNNVFVLSTGRCGSTTFVRACGHISNYSTAHESLWRRVGDARLAYPRNHIEADNRLSWLLGRLDARYGNEAFYVHLTRDREAVARSFDHRWDHRPSIIRAYGQDVLGFDEPNHAVCLDYWDTVNANIEQFLANKHHWMRFRLENAATDFRIFWEAIGAQGELENALREWNRTYNETPRARGRQGELWRASRRKVARIVRGLPNFVRKA